MRRIEGAGCWMLDVDIGYWMLVYPFGDTSLKGDNLIDY
jgi:hypothetical protein